MSFDFYTSAFHPKALNNVCVDMAGLLAYDFSQYLPISLETVV
jgi:hypothetical protein